MKTSQIFTESIDEALSKTKQSEALHLFGDAYMKAREKAYEGLDFAAMRDELAEIKDEVRKHRRTLLADFIKRAEACGSTVFVAESVQEANEYVANVAKSAGVKKIVKSKSMVSEESHFNKALEKHGINVAETDLGEWIIQLARQRPSHPVMPAIHLFKEEVAELFSKEAKEDITPEIETLVERARNRLRGEYFEADLGLTGANFLVAETGGIGIVTNEGNARLCATLPTIHVVFASVHKLVRSISDAIKITRLLPRNATGQLLTSYVTWIKGPLPHACGEKQQHIVLINDKREKLYEDNECKDALRCIQCGACANVCPVYQTVGGHVFGSIYIAAIGAIYTAHYEGLGAAKDLVRACIGCRACSAVCPSGIDLEKIILHLRSQVTEQFGMGVVKNVAFKGVMKNRKLFHSLVRTASLLQKPLVTSDNPTSSQKYIRHLPLHFMEGDFTAWRDLPAIAEKAYRDKTVHKPLSSPRYRVAFFVGCGGDFIYPEVGHALEKILDKENVEMSFPQSQNCCGIPAIYSGDMATSRELAKENVEALSGDYDFILTICPTCTTALREGFVERLQDNTILHNKALAIAKKTMDASAFLVNVLGMDEALESAGKSYEKVTYHDSCHLKRGSKVWQEPRSLLQSFDYEIVEMKNSDRCCGFGGSYSFLSHPEISEKITEDKVETIIKTEAMTVAVDCPGCMIMLKGALGKKDKTLQCKHTLELIAAHLS